MGLKTFEYPTVLHMLDWVKGHVVYRNWAYNLKNSDSSDAFYTFAFMSRMRPYVPIGQIRFRSF